MYSFRKNTNWITRQRAQFSVNCSLFYVGYNFRQLGVFSNYNVTFESKFNFHCVNDSSHVLIFLMVLLFFFTTMWEVHSSSRISFKSIPNMYLITFFPKNSQSIRSIIPDFFPIFYEYILFSTVSNIVIKTTLKTNAIYKLGRYLSLFIVF